MRPSPVPASVVRRRTSMPGCCAWKSNNRGISHFTVKVLKQATSSGPRRESLTSRTASAMLAKAVVSTGCSTCAAGVRVGAGLAAVKQGHAQVLLQLAHLAADRAGRDRQLVRGRRHAAQPGGGLERAQGTQWGQAMAHLCDFRAHKFSQIIASQS